MSEITDLKEWAESVIPDSQANVIYPFQGVEGQYAMEWLVDDQRVGAILMTRKDDLLYMESVQLDSDYQKNGVYKSMAAFIPKWARKQGVQQLVVIAANPVMQSLLNKCGFELRRDPDNYFVDISMEDSPPEQYGNSRP